MSFTTNCTHPTGSCNFVSLWKKLLVHMYSKLHSKSCDYHNTYCWLNARTKVAAHPKRPFICVTSPRTWVNDPLHPNISMLILHTALRSFPKLLHDKMNFINNQELWIEAHSLNSNRYIITDLYVKLIALTKRSSKM